MALLEIACFSAEHALHAFRSGADRIELCENREAGGTTPLFRDAQMVKQNVGIPLYVMIRPRGGDFSYSHEEFEEMMDGIDQFRSTADGFVFGILNGDLTIDISKTSQLVQRAAPLPCTFHRAFDETLDQRKALEDVISTGCQAILTSGGASNAISGADMLRDLVQLAESRITVIAGGGVRAKALLKLREHTSARAYHSSALLHDRAGPDPNEIRQMKMLLQEQPLPQLASINLSKHQKTSLSLDDGDENRQKSKAYTSAVSAGASTPVDEFSN